jgi:predicted transcriptional regulator
MTPEPVLLLRRFQYLVDSLTPETSAAGTAEFDTAGVSLSEMARALGVTRQAVQKMMRR